MSDNNYNSSSALAAADEYAQLQKLSNDYQPEPEGPLVGDRQSSSAITTEYANADPVYRVKTAALPQKYAYFRTCRGDGHCGWRAIAFCYFEAMLRGGDVHKFDDEEVRLRSMINLMSHAGFPEDVYEDFRDQTFELMHDLANAERNNDGTAADILLQSFNDYGISMSIITYFKLLTSAWIQANPADFQPFLLDYGNIQKYCQDNIEIASAEIDHVAMAALAEALVKPAGFGLEVLYLDRSPGSEINNNYRVDPINYEGFPAPDAPIMRLLYRPGHYDILYKAEDFPAPVQHSVPSQAPLHVALAGYTDEFIPVASNVSDVMAMIPGMSGMYSSRSLGQNWPAVSYYDSPASAPPQPQMAPVPSYAPSPSPVVSVANAHQDFVNSVHSSHVNHHNPPRHHSIHLDHQITLPLHPPPPPPPLQIDRATPMTNEPASLFRPSMYELEPAFATNRAHALPFQTSIFRNSHYNTAHFLNPDFQPEEWSPESEYATGGSRGRHKSTSS
ncbi:peptidase C65 Otubain-domain-containing protein [Dendryphion nanum]|uniref:ubiquitinyl hydrolase 1 n=1 Tax=Dendryphion nanum TaxID=256645 RepID=A0A9P9DXC3_9PLEO|nr:peptidase C65 Otubain-domain-containing protein [Dendryphion nanum]